MLERIGSKGNTPPLLVRMQTCTTTLEIRMMISQTIGNQPTSGPSTTLGHIPKRCSIIIQGHLFSYVHCHIICNSQKPGNNLDVPQYYHRTSFWWILSLTTVSYVSVLHREAGEKHQERQA